MTDVKREKEMHEYTRLCGKAKKAKEKKKKKRERMRFRHLASVTAIVLKSGRGKSLYRHRLLIYPVRNEK